MIKRACLTFTLLALPAALHAQPARPNALLVLSDDHSAAHVGVYGKPDIKTPNLDAFAQQGMRFERMYVAAPQCVPSRAALMTGPLARRAEDDSLFGRCRSKLRTGWNFCATAVGSLASRAARITWTARYCRQNRRLFSMHIS
jgi:Sulfatase